MLPHDVLPELESSTIKQTTSDARALPTRTGRIFYASAIATSLAVGALQMYHVHGGVLTNYGADVFGTAWLYAMTRLGRTIFQRGRIASPEIAAIVVFALCVASELGQKLHLVPGRYDAYDLLAYTLTVTACWLIDSKVATFVRYG